MDRQSVFSIGVYERSGGENDDSNLQVRTLLESFILDFRLDNLFVYRSASPLSLYLACPRSTKG